MHLTIGVLTFDCFIQIVAACKSFIYTYLSDIKLVSLGIFFLALSEFLVKLMLQLSVTEVFNRAR